TSATRASPSTSAVDPATTSPSGSRRRSAPSSPRGYGARGSSTRSATTRSRSVSSSETPRAVSSRRLRTPRETTLGSPSSPHDDVPAPQVPARAVDLSDPDREGVAPALAAVDHGDDVAEASVAVDQ